MTLLDDAAFYAAREKQERAMASQSSDPTIAQIHLIMAERYLALQNSRAAAGRPSLEPKQADI